MIAHGALRAVVHVLAEPVRGMERYCSSSTRITSRMTCSPARGGSGLLVPPASVGVRSPGHRRTYRERELELRTRRESCHAGTERMSRALAGREAVSSAVRKVELGRDRSREGSSESAHRIPEVLLGNERAREARAVVPVVRWRISECGAARDACCYGNDGHECKTIPHFSSPGSSVARDFLASPEAGQGPLAAKAQP